MAIPSIVSDEMMRELEKAFEADALDRTNWGTSFIRIATQPREPVREVFRWKLSPLPGYSHAHSRKIRRERQARLPITIDYLKYSTVYVMPGQEGR